MKRRFSLLHGVTDEISEAFHRYEGIRKELGVQFMADLDDAYRRIQEMPEAYAPSYKRIRRVMLRKFPYIVSYVCDPDAIHIVTIRHGARSERSLRKVIRDRLAKGD